MGARERLDGSSEGGYAGLGNEIRRVAKGYPEGWQMISTSRGGSRAELLMPI